MLLSIDLSLRSAGVVLFNLDGSIEDFMVTNNKESKDEDLLIKNANDILTFIKGRDIKIVAIEGLSFASISSSKDTIAGNFWNLRCALKQTIDLYIQHIVPVTRWRKLVISKERVKELELEIGQIVIKVNKKGKESKKVKLPSGWQKKECVRVLPEEVNTRFSSYVKENKLKKEAIYDLTDAYWLGKYIFTL
jgi:hypothetical protein